MSALDSASTEATDRSISAATITIASGSAISAISERSSEPVVNESVVRNSGEISCPATASTASSAISSVSQRPSTRRQSRGGAAPAAGAASGDVMVSACTAHAPAAQRGLEAQADEPVERDRDEQQRPDGGLLPERLDPQNDQGRGDRRQQQRAEGGAVDGARAAEDRHAADDGGRDDRQLVADAGSRVDRAEARSEQHAAQAGKRAGEHERHEYPPLRAHARQPGA